MNAAALWRLYFFFFCLLQIFISCMNLKVFGFRVSFFFFFILTPAGGNSGERKKKSDSQQLLPTLSLQMSLNARQSTSWIKRHYIQYNIFILPALPPTYPISDYIKCFIASWIDFLFSFFSPHSCCLYRFYIPYVLFSFCLYFPLDLVTFCCCNDLISPQGSIHLCLILCESMYREITGFFFFGGSLFLYCLVDKRSDTSCWPRGEWKCCCCRCCCLLFIQTWGLPRCF